MDARRPARCDSRSAFPRREQVRLAGELVERARPHPRGERLRGRRRANSDGRGRRPWDAARASDATLTSAARVPRSRARTPAKNAESARCQPRLPWNSGIRFDAPTYSVTPAESASPYWRAHDDVGRARRPRPSRRRAAPRRCSARAPPRPRGEEEARDRQPSGSLCSKIATNTSAPTAALTAECARDRDAVHEGVQQQADERGDAHAPRHCVRLLAEMEVRRERVLREVHGEEAARAPKIAPRASAVGQWRRGKHVDERHARS